LNPDYDVINDVICGFAKVVVERCGFHHWIAYRISCGQVGLRFSLSLIVSELYDVINDVIMSDADCTPGREPRSVAASFFSLYFIFLRDSILVLSERFCTVNYVWLELQFLGHRLPMT